MKKMRIIALALVLAIALLGAGYAAWGTDIKNSTTLNTGHWEVILEADAADSLAAGDKVFNYVKTETGFEETTLKDADYEPEYEIVDGINPVTPVGSNYVYTVAPKIEDKTVIFEFHNMHPGTMANTFFEIRNRGSIPAKITDVSVKFPESMSTEQTDLFNALKTKFSATLHTGYPVYEVVPGTPANEISLSSLEAALKTAFVGLILKPEQYIKVGDNTWPTGTEAEIMNFYFKLPANALTGNLGMDATLPIEMTFTFDQYNIQP